MQIGLSPVPISMFFNRKTNTLAFTYQFLTQFKIALKVIQIYDRRACCKTIFRINRLIRWNPKIPFRLLPQSFIWEAGRGRMPAKGRWLIFTPPWRI